MIGWISGVILFLPALLAGCLSAPTIGIEEGEELVIEKSSFSFEQTKMLFDEYKIQPGDMLDILFNIQTRTKEARFSLSLGDTVSVHFPYYPEWNSTQKIRPDGTISLPVVREVQIADKTIPEITQYLTQRYEGTLKNPELYITVPEFLAQIRELKHDLHTSARGLSRLVTVRPDGYVTFPMVGNILVAGKTIEEVTILLNEQYKKVSSSLFVDLFLEKTTGSVVHVLGEVARPGPYTISKPISAIEAISKSGGFTSDAELSTVVVIRRHKKKVVATMVNLEEMLHLRSGRLFYVSPNDVLYIPKTRIASAAHLMEQVRQATFFQGWSVGLSWVIDDEPMLGKTPPFP